MGMLVNGEWSNDDNRIHNGVYIRQAALYSDDLPTHCLEEIKAYPGRFVLFASYSCGWCHRVMLTITFKEISSLIPVYVIGGKRIQGYPMNNNQPFPMPKSNKVITYLHELYSMHNETYTGRATVPVLWDTKTNQIICNESAILIRAFNKINVSPSSLDLYPTEMHSEIERWNDSVYENLSNAVYEAGFSTKESEITKKVTTVYDFLAQLETHFAKNKYLMGDHITESDIRLFSTLIRFDTSYTTVFRCLKKPLTDFKNVMDYTRMIYQLPNVSKDIDFDAMYQSCLENDSKSQTDSLEKPIIDWGQPISRTFNSETIEK